MSINVILVNYTDSDPQIAEPHDILARYSLLRDWAAMIRKSGCHVTVFLRGPRDAALHEAGIAYHIFSDVSPPRRHFYFPLRMHQKIAALVNEMGQSGRAAVVHLNGMLFPLQARLLRAAVGPQVPIIAQHHGSLPWAPGLRRAVQRWGLRAVDAFMFASSELARPWQEAGLLALDDVYEVMELTSRFTLEARSAARAITGLQGKPVVLWTGNLNDNKDPLTILNGFARFLDIHPDARLYMAYRYSPLLNQVRERIAAQPELENAVRLLGKIPYKEMEYYYNSADLFVQGSAKEAAGLALLDALACGVLPVVTNIPAFRKILNDAEVGRLWDRGSEDDFLTALTSAVDFPEKPADLRAFYDRNWHADRIGEKAAAVYELLNGGR